MKTKNKNKTKKNHKQNSTSLKKATTFYHKFLYVFKVTLYNENRNVRGMSYVMGQKVKSVRGYAMTKPFQPSMETLVICRADIHLLGDYQSDK